MHFVACVQAIAGTAQHTLPPSEVVCKVTYRSAVASLLLYDVSGRNLQQDSAPAWNQLRHFTTLTYTWTIHVQAFAAVSQRWYCIGVLSYTLSCASMLWINRRA